MPSHRHRRRHSSGSRRRSRPFATFWVILAVAFVGVLFTYTASTPEIPDGDPREYPGSARNIHSKVLPRTAKEASDEFHRTYDAPDTTYAGDHSDPVAESRRRYREQNPDRRQPQQQPVQRAQASKAHGTSKPARQAPGGK